jgi:outer membrane protein TolC
LLIKKNIKLMEDNLANANRRTAMAQANYKAALVPELSVLQAQVAAENLKPAIADLRNAWESALAALAMNLGLPSGTSLQLDDVSPPDFIPLDTAKLISEAAQNKPELQELRRSILLLQSNRKLVYENTYTPTLSLAYTMDPTFQRDVWKDSWFDGNNWAQRSGMFRLTLGFRLNGLLPVSKEALGLTEMDDNLQKLNIGLSQAIRGTEVDVYTQVLKLEKSQKSMEAQRLNVDLAQRAYQLTEEAYKAGLKDLLEVQNAELEFQKAKLEVIKEQFNYMTGLIDLEYTIGVPFGTLSRSK